MKIIFSITSLILIALTNYCFSGEAPKRSPEADSSANYSRSTLNNDIPDVMLTRMDGKEVSLIDELNDGRPVLVNFVFTSCSAICPMLSHIFSVVENRLTKKQTKFHLVSISIDPETDSPATLADYAKRYQAGKNWDFYTGSLKNSLAVQKAFKVFRGDKMNHASVALFRPVPGKPWIRIEGFFTPDALLALFNPADG